MVSIRKGNLNDINLLTKISKTSFLEAHGESASEKDINEYVSNTFTNKVFEKELNNIRNVFNLVYYDEIAVGYSKVIFNSEHSNIPFKNVTKLERLYVLESFHNLKLGFQLFKHNLNEALKNNQAGLWLFVWTENHKAINFYKKVGFEVVDQHDFKISDTHSNPNYQMLLTFKN